MPRIESWSRLPAVAQPFTCDFFRSRFKTVGAPSLRFLQGREGMLPIPWD